MAADEVKITAAVVLGTLDPTKSHLTSSPDVSHSMFVVSLAAGRIYCVVEREEGASLSACWHCEGGLLSSRGRDEADAFWQVEVSEVCRISRERSGPQNALAQS